MIYIFPFGSHFLIDLELISSGDDNDQESVENLKFLDDMDEEMKKEAESFHKQEYQIKLLENEKLFENKLKEVG